MNSEEFDKTYREFKVGDDLHDDVKFYISDEQLNKEIHTLVEENKELKDKIKKQQRIIKCVKIDLLSIDYLLNNSINYLNDKCIEMDKEL